LSPADFHPAARGSARASGSCRREQPHGARSRAGAGDHRARSFARQPRESLAVRCAPRGAPLAAPPTRPRLGNALSWSTAAVNEWGVGGINSVALQSGAVSCLDGFSAYVSRVLGYCQCRKGDTQQPTFNFDCAKVRRQNLRSNPFTNVVLRKPSVPLR